MRITLAFALLSVAANCVGAAGPLNKAEQLTLMHENERSVKGGSSLVAGFDHNQIRNKMYCEDRGVQHQAGENGLFFGVFDGHVGNTTSELLAKSLTAIVTKKISTLGNGPSDERNARIAGALKESFQEFDARIINVIDDPAVQEILKGPLVSEYKIDKPERKLAKKYLLERLHPAISGSCALLAYITENESKRHLYVANVGDSRAVLGRRVRSFRSNTWQAVDLSLDHKGSTPSEEARIRAEHGSEQVIRNGRVFGLGVSRAFGDAGWKWAPTIAEKILNLGVYVPGPSVSISPPYLTATPDVVDREIEDEDEFMILASDGLWDKLTSDDAVQLVGQLMDPHTRPWFLSSWIASFFSSARKKSFEWAFEDSNSATHLLRNALGGSRTKQIENTLAREITWSGSNMGRDDITVTVVWLNKKQADGTHLYTEVNLADANFAL